MDPDDLKKNIYEIDVINSDSDSLTLTDNAETGTVTAGDYVYVTTPTGIKPQSADAWQNIWTENSDSIRIDKLKAENKELKDFIKQSSIGPEWEDWKMAKKMEED